MISRISSKFFVSSNTIQKFKHFCNSLEKRRLEGLQRAHEICFRFLYNHVPLHQIPHVKRLTERVMVSTHRAVLIDSHIDTSTPAGKAVANFQAVPKPYFCCDFLSSAQKTKLVELRRFGAQFDRLFALSQNPWATMRDMDRGHWEAYDGVNFALLTEHFVHLVNILNNPTFMPAQKAMLDIGVDLPAAVVSEALALGLAYIEGIDGQTIRLPVNRGGLHQLQTYTIQEFHFGKALPGYILRPNEEGPIWIIARGTQTLPPDKWGVELRKGTKESQMCDLHPESMTRDAVDSALADGPLREVLEHADRPVFLGGHSLGGALIADITTRYPWVEKAFAFSAPKMSAIEAKRWDAHPSKALVSLDAKGDIVPGAGKEMRGLHVEISPLAREFSIGHNPLVRHNTCNLTTPFMARVIDHEKDTLKRERELLETLRLYVGRFMDHSFARKG